MEINEIKMHLKDEILDYYRNNKIRWKFNETINLHLLLVDYFEILRKHIVPKKRVVLIAPELLRKMNTAEYAGWKARLYEIKEKFENRNRGQ